MIGCYVFCAELQRRGIGLVTGVPCAYFSAVLRLLEGQPSRDLPAYLPAANEGVALAVAAGAELAGTRSALLIQNSGFGNLLDPLASLLLTFDIPVVVFMSLRGWPDPAADEPQHAVMGRATRGLLDTLGVAYSVLGPHQPDLVEALDVADRARAAGKPAFVLVPKHVLTPAVDHTGPRAAFDRATALDALVPFLDDALVFGTAGYIGRELYGRADRPLTFYMQGSTGHALGLGLGAALAQPERRVVVVDGDGAILKHLGAMVTTGQAGPANLVHVVLDNAVYESTGGQSTSSRAVDWVRLATAAGYRSGSVCASAVSLRTTLLAVRPVPGPHLVVARIGVSPGHVPPQVTAGLAPAALRARFQAAALEPVGSGR
jgi:phosphonopyruvate decarboxylase